jgi:type IV secretory pathway VirJ component
MQSPPGTFAGAIAFDFCGQNPLHAPLCPGPGLRSDVPASWLTPAHSLADPLLLLRSSNTSAACPAGAPSEYTLPAPLESEVLGSAVAKLAALARSRAVSAPAELGDLPIIEVPAQSAARPDVFGILLSGDGGWAGLDKDLSTNLAERGLPVVGIDSLRYFWRERAPESAAAGSSTTTSTPGSGLPLC